MFASFVVETFIDKSCIPLLQGRDYILIPAIQILLLGKLTQQSILFKMNQDCYKRHCSLETAAATAKDKLSSGVTSALVIDISTC